MSTLRLTARHGLVAMIASGSFIFVGTSLAQNMPADLNAESGARLPYLTRQDLGEEGRRLSDIFARDGQPDDPISGPLAFAAYNIPVAISLLDLHDGAIGGTLDAHARELAIMVACRETNYTLEWNAHERAALNAGVDAGVLDVVRNDKALAGLAEQDATIIRFGRELLRDRQMSSATFAKAVALFGEHGAMDLVALMSTYAVSGFYAIAVNEHPPGEAMLAPLK